jgi:hypothetical protein
VRARLFGLGNCALCIFKYSATVQFRMNSSFGRGRERGGGVEIHPECTDVTPTNVPRFTRPDEPPAKKKCLQLESYLIQLGMGYQESRSGCHRNKLTSRTRKRYENILDLYHVLLITILQSYIKVVYNECSLHKALNYVQKYQLRNLRFPQRYSAS